MTGVNVLVTGVGGGGFGEQLVKALRLSSVAYVVHGTDITDLSLGFETVDHAHVLPRATEPGYIDQVLELCVSESIEVVLAGSEAELMVISRHRRRLEELGIFVPLNPVAVLDVCMDKFKTYDWLRERGHAVPLTVHVKETTDLDSVDIVPAVIKPSVGGGGSANVLLAQTRGELSALGRYLLETVGPFVIQEYVGDVHSEFTVGVLLDMEGQLVDSIAVRRDISSGLSNRIRVANRTGRFELGSVLAISSGVSQGEVGRFPQVTEECEQIALDMGARGAINIQCRLWNGRPHVFEINPRFSGTTSIRAMVGFNEPDWLIRRHVLGERLQGRIEYRVATVMRGLSERVVATRPR